METKVWIALCAILVVHSGSASHDKNNTAALSTSTTDPQLDHVSTSTKNPLTVPKTGTGSNATDSLNSTASSTITAEPQKHDVTTVSSDTTSTKNESVTQSAPPPSQSHPTPPAPTQNSTTNTSQAPAFPSITSSSVASTSSPNHVSQALNISDKPTQVTTLPAGSTPRSEPSKPAPTPTTTKSNTSSTSSSQNSTTSRANSQPTTAQPHSQTIDPLPLNGKDTTTTRGSPALDPLLAGLVSAFIIAAVIITLLLFLKLRRRSNGPAFHRLQDLPMDDMEDTPLSMYSY